ncbi:hypothetical protein PR048_000484 [Dryococelus australis]|uniref:Uncharacterized protein n=1 Tax=Dryococelus australis TaxID=614101 RepID=A0ABQ9IER2_9NEOP|nr:hypothetical protein PR048_000484 [Dryococelus australis]
MALKTAPVYQIPAPEPFSFKGEDWEIYKSRFARFHCPSGLSNEQEGPWANALLYLIKDKVEIILQSFNLNEADAKKYTTVLAKFDAYFMPAKNIIYEMYKFHIRFQQEGESVETFNNDLYTIDGAVHFSLTTPRRVPLPLKNTRKI